jgi:lambda family phage portal protein
MAWWNPWKKNNPEPAPAPGQRQRSYAGARVSRLENDWITSSSSADTEIWSSLRLLRNRARQLVRDNDYAGCALRKIVNSVDGTGIGLQSQVRMRRGDRLDENLNTQIEELWKLSCQAKHIDVSGQLCFADIERLALRSVVESGEVLIRIHEGFATNHPIPFALEIIEPDQLIDNHSICSATPGNYIRMGVEMDRWRCPQAYWIYPYHPGDIQASPLLDNRRPERVPAREILHLFVVNRPGQTRGITWFHTALTRMRQLGAYEEAELIAARAQAAVMGFIQTPDVDVYGEGDEGDQVDVLEPGTVKTLAPGETFSGFSPTRPGDSFDPFVRMMLRGMAAGLGLSYESLSHDFTNTSYSSARVSMIDERDHWKILQSWFTRNFHQPIFERWLEIAVLSGALSLPGYEANPRYYNQPRWCCRGWQWVDPKNEIAATKEAIAIGMTSLSAEVAEMGGDLEEVLEQRRREMQLAQDKGIVLDFGADIKIMDPGSGPPPLVANIGVGGTQALLSFFQQLSQSGLPKDNVVNILVAVFGIDKEIAGSMVPDAGLKPLDKGDAATDETPAEPTNPETQAVVDQFFGEENPPVEGEGRSIDYQDLEATSVTQIRAAIALVNDPTLLPDQKLGNLEQMEQALRSDLLVIQGLTEAISVDDPHSFVSLIRSLEDIRDEQVGLWFTEAQRATGKPKNCKNSKACGNSCVAKTKKCKSDLPKPAPEAAKATTKAKSTAKTKKATSSTATTADSTNVSAASAKTTPKKTGGKASDKSAEDKAIIVPELHDFYDFAKSKNGLTASEQKRVSELLDIEDLNKFQVSKVAKLQKDGLTPVEAAAFEGYIGGSYKEMNSALYNSKIERETSPSDWEDQMLVNKAALSAMKKIPPTTEADIQKTIETLAGGDSQGYKPGDYMIRHENIPNLESYLAKHREAMESGKPLIKEQFLSTTFKQDGLIGFSADANVEVRIKAKLDGTGNSVLVDKYKNKAFESEVLFKPMTSFKITSVEIVPDQIVTETYFKPSPKAEKFNATDSAFSVAEDSAMLFGGGFVSNFKTQLQISNIDPKEFAKELEGGKITKKAVNNYLEKNKIYKDEREEGTRESIIPGSNTIVMEEI